MNKKMSHYVVPILGTLLLFCLQLGCSNPCRKVECENGGSCFEGVCLCREGWIGDQCEIDECSLRDCQNGSECLLGTCECLPGYYGADCEFSYQDLFIGSWSADQFCTSTSSGTSNSQYTCLITAGGNEMEINLYLDSYGWVTADIDDEAGFTILSQQQTFGTFNGSGSFSNDSTITLMYTRRQSNDTMDCLTSLVRQ